MYRKVACATITAAVTAIALTAITPAYADAIPSDTLTLTRADGFGVAGAPASISAFDTPITGVVVETPGAVNVIGLPLSLFGVQLNVFNLSALPIAFTDPGGTIGDIVGVCSPSSPCADGSPQGIFFISDPFEFQATGPFSAILPETGQPQSVNSLLSDFALMNGVTATFSSDVEVPGPIAGAGLPGLILACGIILVTLARRRRKLVS